MICLNYSTFYSYETRFVSIPYFYHILKTLKNIFVAFLAFCVLGFSGGVNIVKHYCGETLKEVSLNKEAAMCCDEHEPSPETDLFEETCCLDQVSFFKTFEFEKEKTCIAHVVATNRDIDKSITVVEKPSNLIAENLSLPPPKIPIYKRVQHFLI